MARKSTGEIEEGYVDFNGDASKAITFELKATGQPNFTSPPQVKLSSIERIDHLYKYLIFDQSGTYKAEYSVGTLTKYGLDDAYNPQLVKAVGPSAAIPYQPEYVSLAGSNSGALGFSFADERRGEPTNSDTVILYFQLWFNAAFDSSDDIRIFFGKNSGSYSVSTSDAANHNLSLSYNLKVNDSSGNWVGGKSGTGKYIQFDQDDVDATAAATLPTDETEIRWCRLSLTGTIATLGKFTFNVSASSSELAFFANPIIHYADDDLYQFRFNPNIGVTFKDVTTSGMTIICSARLHGRIRYLLSI